MYRLYTILPAQRGTAGSLIFSRQGFLAISGDGKWLSGHAHIDLHIPPVKRFPNGCVTWVYGGCVIYF